MNYYELADLVREELNNLVGVNACENIWSDVDQYEFSIRVGMEPTRDQLYCSDIGGICLAGETGLLTEEQLTTEQLAMLDDTLGQLHYSVPGIVEMIISTQDYSLENIRSLCTFVVAHERRHVVQRLVDFPNMCQFAAPDSQEYLAAAHEVDANVFAIAVLHGEAAMADVATYVPTQQAIDSWCERIASC